MYAKLDEVKWAMLQEWSETRRALAMPRDARRQHGAVRQSPKRTP